jgi:DNA-directed RNA polymerase subunit RPC12/RpoP
VPWAPRRRYRGEVITRYRCAACGNLTRFDVTSTKTTKAFHHFTVGGDLVVEDEEVLEQTVHEVACRWCGHGRSVEIMEDDVSDTGVGTAGSSTSR